jgi:serine/threonine protein kinase
MGNICEKCKKLFNINPNVNNNDNKGPKLKHNLTQTQNQKNSYKETLLNDFSLNSGITKCSYGINCNSAAGGKCVKGNCYTDSNSNYKNKSNLFYRISLNKKNQISNFAYQQDQVYLNSIENNNTNNNNSNNTNINPNSININFNDFDILKLLGQGSFGNVFLVKQKLSEKLFAMKVLNKEKIYKSKQVNQTKTERKILEKLDNPFIVKLYFAFQSKNRLFLVTEFIQGGELFEQIKLNLKLNEKVVRFYTCEIIIAIEFMHKKGIIYRDLKPENILIDTNGHIKITDFGLSKNFDYDSDYEYDYDNHNSNNNNYNRNLFSYEIKNKVNSNLPFKNINSNNSNSNINIDSNSNIKGNENINNNNSNNKNYKTFTICGTPEYLAPEILTKEGYDKSVDWWSLGILILEMLIGKRAFKHIFNLVNKNRLKKFRFFSKDKNQNQNQNQNKENENERNKEINSYSKINFNELGISKEAENLIKSLLQEDPNLRLGYGDSDSESIKSHPFFNGINWDFVYQRKYKPDFIPNLSNEFDLKYFDKSFTSQKIDNYNEDNDKFKDNDKNNNNEIHKGNDNNYNDNNNNGNMNKLIFKNNKFVRVNFNLFNENKDKDKNDWNKDFENFSYKRDSIEL